MTNQEMYQAIFHRKSVRKYDSAPLSKDQLLEIEAFAQKANPLIREIGCKFFLLDAKEMGMAVIKAPHYLCLYSEKKDGYLLNAGFTMQQVDLWLSHHGYGSCWIGMGKPAGTQPEAAGMEYVIMLAFGTPAEPACRKKISEFRRNSLSEISQIYGANELTEPVRLAPSANNTQPRLLAGSAREILLCRRKFNPIKGAVYGKLNQIDMGIALCHLWLSIENQGKQAEFDFCKQAAPAGSEFMVKVSLK
jgi:hypothetical protein